MLLGLLLAKPYGSNLRIGIYAAWHHAHINSTLAATDYINHVLPLGGSHMSQLDIASHGITDSIYPINAGMPISISHQGTPVHLRLYPITKQPFKSCPAPGCHQHCLDTCHLLLALFVQIGHRHAASLAADSLNLAGGLNHRPQLFQLHG